MPRLRHLVLTEDQETELERYLKHRLPALNEERIKADKQGDEDYRNSKDRRALPDTVWQQSNMSVPLTSWVVDHFSARTEDEVFGRSPICHFAPEGPADEDLARGLDRWASYRLFKMGKVEEALLDATQYSMWTHRALILKAIYDEDVDEWDEAGLNVLWDASTEEPVQALDHGYIVEGRDTFTPGVDPVTGDPVEVFDKDPTIRFDPTRHVYAPSPEAIRMREVKYAGARSREVDSDCFFAPSDARCLDDADCLVEYYDKPIHWMRDRFYERPWNTLAEFEGQLGNQTAGRKTGERRKKATKDQKAYDIEAAMFGIEEIWLTRDVLGWGRPQKIVIWRERKTGVLVDYEFRRKVTPTGCQPFTAISVWKPHGGKFWWGYSLVEMMRPFQDYIDEQWNRHSFRNQINANPIVGQNPDAIAEKKTFHELRPFDAVTLEQGQTMEDWLSVFTFPKLDLDTQELITKTIEWCNYWLGISDIARGDYSNVPQNTTLGGQEATLKEASKLSRRWTRRMTLGFEDHLCKLLEIAVETMDPEEAYTFLEGDADQAAFIAKDALKTLKLNAKLIIGKERGVQDIQAQQLALQTVEKYFSYPPEIQLAARPLIKQVLYLLGHDDVDTLIPVPVIPPPMAIGPGGEVIPFADGSGAPPEAAPAAEAAAPPEPVPATAP